MSSEFNFKREWTQIIINKYFEKLNLSQMITAEDFMMTYFFI